MSADHDHDHHAVHADASVREARATDAPAVGLVQSVVWRAAYADVVPDEVLAAFEPNAFAATWRRSLEAPPAGIHKLLVACAGAQVVGFVAVGPTQDPDAGDATGELLTLGVHPDARRAGHGSRLVNAAMDTLGAAGADTAYAWVLTLDEDTRAFLLGAGFTPDGAHRARVVGPGGESAGEVRLVVGLADAAPAEDDAGHSTAAGR